MFPKIARTVAPTVALLGVLAVSATPAAGQAAVASPAAVARQAPVAEKQLRTRQVAPLPAVTTTEDPNAERTREELMRLFEKYPPSVARVLKMDPSLLLNSDYLATYPALNSFLAQHPEVSRSPAYYLERIRTNSVEYVDTRSNVPGLRDVGWMGSLTVATLAALAQLSVAVHRLPPLVRLSDRGEAQQTPRPHDLNEEMLAYVKSPAGGAQIGADYVRRGPGQRIGAPTRIQLAIQPAWSAGGRHRVALIARRSNDLDAQKGTGAFGILGIAIGIGFILSGLVSYVLSSRLGLLDEPQAPAPRPMAQE